DRPGDLADLFAELVAEGRMAGYEVRHRFYEIGSPEGLAETEAHIRARQGGVGMSHTRGFLDEAKRIIDGLDAGAIDRLVERLAALRAGGGRLFFLGVGGSAANAAHAVNDFRKIAGIEAYAPTDNVSELTARTNDEGWESVFVEWLRVSRLGPRDVVFV